MHHRLKSLSIRSCADELPKPRFSCLLAATEPGLGPKKRAGRYELDHFTTWTYQSRQISSANAAGSRLARQTQSLYNSFAATEIWDPGPGRAGPAGLLPGTGFIFRGYMPYLSNSAQKRSVKQKRLLFWYKLVAAVGTEILVDILSIQDHPWRQ